MTLNQFIDKYLSKGDKFSRDAVELLLKLAWEEATETQRRKQPKQPEIIGPYEIDCLEYNPPKKEIIGPYDIP